MFNVRLRTAIFDGGRVASRRYVVVDRSYDQNAGDGQVCAVVVCCACVADGAPHTHTPPKPHTVSLSPPRFLFRGASTAGRRRASRSRRQTARRRRCSRSRASCRAWPSSRCQACPRAARRSSQVMSFLHAYPSCVLSNQTQPNTTKHIVAHRPLEKKNINQGDAVYVRPAADPGIEAAGSVLATDGNRLFLVFSHEFWRLLA